MVVIMMLASVSCSKHDDKDIDLPPTPPEEEEVPTINPIMTDFDDINQLYGTWTATEIKDGEDWYQLENPVSITFKSDGCFSYEGSNTLVTGTYTYRDSTAICSRTDVLPVITGGYKFKFYPFDDKKVIVQMTVVTVGVVYIMDFIASKTAEEQKTRE